MVELGAFWLDILKDRLYTTPAKSAARRSAQTAMYHIAEAMVRWLAPILSFTAEEIWKFLPGERDASVLLLDLVEAAGGRGRRTPIDWDAVIALKADVARELGARCAPRARSARRSRPRWTCISTRRSIGAWPRSATNCASC